MELTVWNKAFGLPAFDSKCLMAMAFCKFAEAPVTFTVSGNPWKSATGELPVLKSKDKKISGVDEIFNFFRSNKCTIDDHLSRKEVSLMNAYMAMVEENLAPAFEHCMWVDSQNFNDVIRPWFSKSMIFPLSLFLPGRLRQFVIKRLFHSTEDNLPESEKEHKIYKKAKECINILSNVLADKDYFFGEQPCSLDAMVFGFLALLEKTPFRNKILQQHLALCSNLVQFCHRITSKHFHMESKEEEPSTVPEIATDEFPHKTRNTIISLVFAVSAMVAYAFLSGMIVIQVADKGGNSESEKKGSKFYV